MKFFIDTADVNELRAACELGCVDGVITTPDSLAKAGRPAEDTLRELCALVDAPVSAPSKAVAAAALVAEGRQLAALHPNLVITIPMGVEGLKAVNALADEGFRTFVSCSSLNQALLAMKAGATFVSAFPGAEGLRDLVTLVRNFGSKTQVVVSARQPEHVHEAALLGADAVSLPFALLRQLAQESRTSWS